MPDLMLGREVAELFDVHPESVRRWAEKGILPCVRTLGGHRRFRPSDVEKLRTAWPAEHTRRIGSGRVHRKVLLTVCDICSGDQGVTCPECDGACVSMADLPCPKCAGIGVVTPEHCCACQTITPRAAAAAALDLPTCACPPAPDE